MDCIQGMQPYLNHKSQYSFNEKMYVYSVCICAALDFKALFIDSIHAGNTPTVGLKVILGLLSGVHLEKCFGGKWVCNFENIMHDS